MDDKELKQRTKDFAHKCVKLTFELPKKELVFPLLDEANELTSIFYASRKTARLKK